MGQDETSEQVSIRGMVVLGLTVGVVTFEVGVVTLELVLLFVIFGVALEAFDKGKVLLIGAVTLVAFVVVVLAFGMVTFGVVILETE